MTDATKEQPKYLGLPKVTIEIVAFTPEQRQKGEPGTVRRIENTNSWLRQMAEIMRSYLANDDLNSAQDTGGNPRTIDSSQSAKLSAFGTNVLGVQAGTGSTAVDRDDFLEDVRIIDGNSANRLVYAALGILTKSTAIAGGYRVILERNFQNDSGGDITVNETAVRVFCDEAGGGNVSLLILRDVISPGHLVVNGGAVIIRYLFDWLS